MAARKSHGSPLRLFMFGFAVVLPLVLAGTPARAALAISTSATSNVTCSAGVCTATAAMAVLNANDLKQLLHVSDVRVVSGNLAHDIVFNATLKWTGYHRLTLDAYRSIVVRKPLVSEGTGAIALITNDGSRNGAFTIEGTGSITFWDLNSSFTINGYGYRLVGDVATLAAYIAASPTSLYALAKDYDASADGVYASSPIPTTFTGVFDGLGHTVSNLTMKIASGSSSGLFTLVLGTVRNFGLTQAAMPSGSGCTQAGLLTAQNYGTILNAFATASIACTTATMVGGLVGKNNGTITDAFATVSIDCTTATTAGGLVGQNYGTITNAFATGSIDCTDGTTVGGLVGQNNKGIIYTSSAAVDINARKLSQTGGLAGESNGVVFRSHATGNIVGGTYVGGLIGENDYGGQITQSYATGTVDALRYAGGLVGYHEGGQITDGYATGAITGDAPAILGGLVGLGLRYVPISHAYATGSIKFGHYQGGLAGALQAPSYASAYWDTDTAGVGQGCGEGACDGVTGLTTAQFQSGLPSGFDPKIWGENATINNGFPYLLANPPG